MRINIRTRVTLDHHSVFKGFNQSLFTALSPPILPFELIRFDGCNTGDRVVLKIGFPKQIWESLIISNEKTESSYVFVDEGLKLPFPLKKWTHSHIVGKDKVSRSFIIDEIHYFTASWLIDVTIFPVLYFIFAYRKGVYKRIFSS